MRNLNKNNTKAAGHWIDGSIEKTVTCKLSPRNCVLKPGQMGYCGVRGNVDGKLFTFNYGVGVEATIETIETEAVYHYQPGTRILSMGNVGCMMGCKFCQNWSTSQIKHLNKSNLKYYTPEEVINLAKSNNIDMISWTYNDPVVWHEFVIETSKLAKLANIKTLYKSALYIESKPLAELIEVIDIFSISLKSMNPEMYIKHVKGRLEPVLFGILQIAASECHLEISQLIVTGMNDDEEDARKTAKWIVDNIGANTPLHFVGYHPAYMYDKPRTSIKTLLDARNIAMKEGIENCYLGNVYQDDVSNTNCKSCNHLLIQRFGLTVKNKGLDTENKCVNCGYKSTIIGGISKPISNIQPLDISFKTEQALDWSIEHNSLHIIQNSKGKLHIKVKRWPSEKEEYYEMNKGIDRLILSKSSKDETSISIYTEKEHVVEIIPVLDRAHFPVINPSMHSSKYIS